MARRYTDNQLAEHWIKHHPDIRFDEGSQCYRMYTEGCWLEVSDADLLEAIKHLISRAEPGGATVRIVKGVEFLIKLSIRLPKNKWDNRPDILVMKSETMEWEPDGSEFEFRDHSMKDYATRKLEFDWDPEATMPHFQKVLDDALPDKDSQRELQEYFGLCLTMDTKYQKQLWIEGPPGSGKTTVLDALVDMLGNDVLAANVSIKATVDKFGLSHIGGASLLWSDDQTLREIKSIGKMSELIDGGWLRVERKFRDAMSIRSTAKVLWVMNTKPRIADPEGINQGLWRRLSILKFAKGYNKRDPSIYEQVLQEKVGLFNWALDGLERLLERGGEWLQSVESMRLVAEYRGLQGAVDMWADECTQPANDRLPAGKAYRHYKNWCKSTGRSAVTVKDFAHAMGQLGYEKRKSGAKGGREYQELRLLSRSTSS